MNTYWILWTYSANYSELVEVKAKNPTHAIEVATAFYSADFKKKATVYVFDHPPVNVKVPV
jgi:hypothetical protein